MNRERWHKTAECATERGAEIDRLAAQIEQLQQRDKDMDAEIGRLRYLLGQSRGMVKELSCEVEELRRANRDLARAATLRSGSAERDADRILDEILAVLSGEGGEAQ